MSTFASSYIPTTNAAVTRNADVLVYPFILNAGRGTFYAELSTLYSSNTSGAIAMASAFGASGTTYTLGVPSTAAATLIAMRDGTTLAQKTGLTSLQDGVRKRASSWGSLGQIVTGDGAAVASAVFDGDLQGAAIGIGSNTAGAGNFYGTIKNARGWLAQASAAQLVTITS